jgi:hypothetical protein
MEDNATNLLGCLIAVIGIIFWLVISWIATCGLVYLATLCFGYQFSWLFGTGVWIVLWLIKSIIPSGKK